MIHTVKGFRVVNGAEVDVFLELSAFSIVQQMLTMLSMVPLPLLNPACRSGSSQLMYCLKPSLQNFEHDLASM